MALAPIFVEAKMKLPDRAIVTPEFVDLMIEIYTAWLHRVEALYARSRSDMAGRAVANIRRVLPIVRRQSPDLHSGLDYEITRLRGANFSKFQTHEYKGTQYLVGITRHITLVNYLNRREILGELGPYRIFLSKEMFDKSDMRLIHMIPERNPRAVNRHPHHYIGERGSWDHRAVLSGPFHPLTAETGNCWGDVCNPAKGSIDDPDIADLFRLLQYHLTTKGNSPPIYVDSLDFDHTIPEAK